MADVIRKKVVVLHAKASKGRTSDYEWDNCKVEFLNSEDLKPISSDDNMELGLNVATAKLNGSHNIKKFAEAPAFYNVVYEMTVGSDMKPSLKVIDFEYLSPLDASIIEAPIKK